MSRSNHLYTNLDKNLVRVVDTCVNHIFSNGTLVYKNRKDFVTKSIQYQIDREKELNPHLEKIIKNRLEEEDNNHTNSDNNNNRNIIGGNRIVVAAKQKHSR